MAIAAVTTLPAMVFSSMVPDIEFTTTAEAVQVTVSGNDNEVILETTLYPVSGNVVLSDLPGLISDYAKQSLVLSLTVTAEEIVTSGNSTTASVSSSVVYAAADIDEAAASFCAERFLSVLQGTKVTAVGRVEYLNYVGTDSASITAHYSDGTTATFAAVVTQGTNNYKQIDVSPYRFVSSGKTLTYYVVTAGSRTQRYNIDFKAPDCAPILLFDNSFGVQEILYCTGKHEVAPEYTRSSAVIRNRYRNYKIEENRVFKADTGVLNTAMADWCDELFRSEEIYICNIINGTFMVGKEIAITESKSENDNLDNTMPRFTFSYRYAQRNHNVMQTQRAGRIFDNTFDNTFN